MRAKLGIMIVTLTVTLMAVSGHPDISFGQEKKKELKKDPNEGKRGRTVGKLVEKGPNFIEVKADGEEKGRRYVPEWIGGNPDKGGGPDKAVLKIFAGLKVGSRVEVDWVFHERLRALDVKVLRAAE